MKNEFGVCMQQACCLLKCEESVLSWGRACEEIHYAKLAIVLWNLVVLLSSLCHRVLELAIML